MMNARQRTRVPRLLNRRCGMRLSAPFVFLFFRIFFFPLTLSLSLSFSVSFFNSSFLFLLFSLPFLSQIYISFK